MESLVSREPTLFVKKSINLVIVNMARTLKRTTSSTMDIPDSTLFGTVIVNWRLYMFEYVQQDF